MKAKLVGLGKALAGTTKDGREYSTQDVYFLGKVSSVQGQVTAKVSINYLKDENLPEIILGGVYDLDLSDKGYIRNLELLERPKEAKA